MVISAPSCNSFLGKGREAIQEALAFIVSGQGLKLVGVRGKAVVSLCVGEQLVRLHPVPIALDSARTVLPATFL
jgi:hypothetical protein